MGIAVEICYHSRIKSANFAVGAHKCLHSACILYWIPELMVENLYRISRCAFALD